MIRVAQVYLLLLMLRSVLISAARCLEVFGQYFIAAACLSLLRLVRLLHRPANCFGNRESQCCFLFRRNISLGQVS